MLAHGENCEAVCRRQTQRNWWAATVAFATGLVMAVGGYLTGSSGLLAEAIHMLGEDLADLAIVLVVDSFVCRGSKNPRRLRATGGMISSGFLILLMIPLAWTAISRLIHPEVVAAGPIIGYALIGLLGQSIQLAIIRSGQGDNHNQQRLDFHFKTDIRISLSVIGGGVVNYLGFLYGDSLATLYVVYRITRESVEFLDESVREFFT